MDVKYNVRRLREHDVLQMHQLLDCFSTVFDDRESYSNNRPSDSYLSNLLFRQDFFAIAAFDEEKVVGGLAAYELTKYEQPRSEIYIYDLAVLEKYRRKGIATLLIEKLVQYAKRAGAWVVYVQADYVDEPAIQLYSKMGIREEVLHFDISV